MRVTIALILASSLSGCYRWSMDSHLDSAYRAYDEGDCNTVMLELSQAERNSRSRPYMQPEFSMLRGECLERENLFPDAIQTYTFIVTHFPNSEYAFRAKARLDTLQTLGRVQPLQGPATTGPVPAAAMPVSPK